MSTEKLVKMAKQLLEKPFWIPSVETKVFYERVHDDNEGKEEGKLIIWVSHEGDVYIKTDKHVGNSLRFRTLFGGGMSLRVRNALLLLVYAIQLDNEEKPQNFVAKR